MTGDPYGKFCDWYGGARIGALSDPDAVALATADADGTPSVRMVLYRGYREGGYSFFTNYESRKGRELRENPSAAMVFYWAHVGQQIRLEGSVVQLSPAESDSYFRQRPRESQITAALSEQSRPLLDAAGFVARLDAVPPDQPIARPSHWGGFTLVATRYEFWMSGEHRRHSRHVFERREEGWTEAWLYP